MYAVIALWILTQAPDVVPPATGSANVPAAETTAAPPPVETPRVETPRVETPRVETPRVETPRVETPRVDAPKAEPPQVDAPKPEPSPPSIAGSVRELPPLSSWTEKELVATPYAGYILEALLAEAGVSTEDFRNRLFALVIGLANAIDAEEEPRRALAKAIAFFADDLAFTISAERSFATVLPHTIIEKRCGTPVLVAALFLAMLDRQNFPGETDARFNLEPIVVPGGLLLRYEFATYHVTIAPGAGGIISDREALARWPATAHEQREGIYYRKIRRAELAGMLLGELARAHGRAGNQALEERYYRSAVTFYPESPDLRLELARVLLRGGQGAEAASHIADVLRRSPERGEARFLNGVALFAEGKRAEAKEALTAAIDKGYTEEGKAWLYLARIAAAERSLPELKAYLATFKEKSGRRDLAGEIEAVLSQMAVADAVGVLKSTAPYEQRFRAIDLLRERPTTAGKEALISCLEDQNLRLRAYAWQALCSIAGRALPLEASAWWRWLARESEEKRGMALWTLLDAAPPIAERQ